MSHFIIGFDIDGCLADFTSSYIAVLERVSGKKSTLEPGADPPCWHFETEVGFNKADVTKAWEVIKQDQTFWFNLRPMLETKAALDALQQGMLEGHEVYFITNRMGVNPYMQTASWLIRYGFGMPAVLLSPEVKRQSMKGYVAKGLQLTHFIDDKPENCVAVKEQLPECTVALLSKRYNEPNQFELGLKGIKTVTTLLEFFQLLIAEEQASAIIGGS